MKLLKTTCAIVAAASFAHEVLATDLLSSKNLQADIKESEYVLCLSYFCPPANDNHKGC